MYTLCPILLKKNDGVIDFDEVKIVMKSVGLYPNNVCIFSCFHLLLFLFNSKRFETSNTNAFDFVISQNVIGDDTEGAPTIRLVNSIIERAVAERASDIHFEPRESEMDVRMRIDGIMRDILKVPGDK